MKKYLSILFGFAFLLSIIISPLTSSALVAPNPEVFPNNPSCVELFYDVRLGDKDSDEIIVSFISNPKANESNTKNPVSRLQSFLDSEGYLNEKPDGFFGRRTLQAVISFQKANNISPAEGFVGPVTRAKIKTLTCGDLSGPICDYAAPPTDCKYVQGPNYNSNTQCGLVLQCVDDVKVCPTGTTGIYPICIKNTDPVDPTPTSSCVDLSTDLKSGDTNNEVTKLQSFLKSKGYFTENPTGYFGTVTEQAVIAFQKANNITPAAGYVGSITRAKMKELSCGGYIIPTTYSPGILNFESLYSKDPFYSPSFGSSLDLGWNSENIESCVASSNPNNTQWSGNKEINGQQRISNLKERTTFTLSCVEKITKKTISKTVGISCPDGTIEDGYFTCVKDPNSKTSIKLNDPNVNNSIVYVPLTPNEQIGGGGTKTKNVKTISWTTQNAPKDATVSLSAVIYSNKDIDEDGKLDSAEISIASILPVSGSYDFSKNDIDFIIRRYGGVGSIYQAPSFINENIKFHVKVYSKGVTSPGGLSVSALYTTPPILLAEDSSSNFSKFVCPAGFTAGDLSLALGSSPYDFNADKYIPCVKSNVLTSPTVTLTANPTSLENNKSTTLTWSSINATSCIASSTPSNTNWIGAKATSGNQTISNLQTSGSFTLTCTGATGEKVSKSVDVGVYIVDDFKPTVTVISPKGAEVFNPGQNIEVKWTTKNASEKDKISINLIYQNIETGNGSQVSLNDLSYFENSGQKTVKIPNNEQLKNIINKHGNNKFRIAVYLYTEDSVYPNGTLKTASNPASLFTINNAFTYCPADTLGEYPNCIDKTKPSIKLIPSKEEVVLENGKPMLTQKVAWETKDVPANSWVEFGVREYELKNGQLFKELGSVFFKSSLPLNGSIDYKVPFKENVEYRINGFLVHSQKIEGNSNIYFFDSKILNTTCPIGSTGIYPNCLINDITPAIKILSPNGGEIFKPGDTIDIKWESKNANNYTINVSLLYQSSQYSSSPISSVYKWKILNTGSTTMKIPSTEELKKLNIYSNQFKIKAFIDEPKNAGLNSPTLIYDQTDNFFTINIPCEAGQTGTYPNCVTPTIKPTVTITANPTGLEYGKSTTLTWTSLNAISCDASGGWAGAKATNGSQIISNLQTTTTFNLTCVNQSGEKVSKSVDVGVYIVDDFKPTVTVLSPNGGEVFNPGQTIKVKWSSKNLVNPTTTIELRYNIDLGNSIWSAKVISTKKVTSSEQETTFVIPSAEELKVLKFYQNKNAFNFVVWGGAGAGDVAGDVPYDNSDSSFQINIPCDAGQTGTYPNCVTATSALNLTANSTSIQSGGSTTLTWTSSGMKQCQATSSPNHVNFSGSKFTNGSQTISNLTQTTKFTISCLDDKATFYGDTGTLISSVDVNVGTTTTTPKPTVSLTANPTSVSSGGSTSLTWTSANATSCTASGVWTGTKLTSGSQVISNLQSTGTYTLTCVGSGGSTSASATVSVITTTNTTYPVGCTSNIGFSATTGLSCSTTTSSSSDKTPRIAFWSGKVNQHIDSQGIWKTDPDGVSGGGTYAEWGDRGYGDRSLDYCKKWYPNTTSVKDYKSETINTWRQVYNEGPYHSATVMTIECAGSLAGSPVSTGVTSTDTTPRLGDIYPSGETQFIDSKGVWRRDTEKRKIYSSSETLSFCKKWYPSTTSSEPYRKELLKFLDSTGQPVSTDTLTYKCIGGTHSGPSVLGASTEKNPNLCSLDSTLLKGMKSKEVKCLQQKLNQKGYKVVGTEGGKEHTQFGYNTLLALKKFQAENSLKADGILGIKTRELLNQ